MLLRGILALDFDNTLVTDAKGETFLDWLMREVDATGGGGGGAEISRNQGHMQVSGKYLAKKPIILFKLLKLLKLSTKYQKEYHWVDRHLPFFPGFFLRLKNLEHFANL